jgi:hypothetical protein
MKILITKSQYNKLVVNEQMSYYSGYDKDRQAAEQWYKQNAHTVNTVLQIGTAFIPIIGPFISAGIGLADAGIYYNNGDTKKAGIVAILSLLPGVGSVVSKIPGIAQLGQKGMTALAAKLGTNGALTATETAVVDGLAKNAALVQQESSNLVQKLAQKAVQANAKANPIIQNVAKAGINAAKDQVKAKAVTAAYNTVAAR